MMPQRGRARAGPRLQEPDGPADAVAREEKLAPKPAGLSHEQAATVPVSGLTALQAAYDVGHVEAGQSVLVLGYTRDDYADGRTRYDLILDIGGNTSISRLRRALVPRGTVVFVGGENAGTVTGMRRQLRGALLSPLLRQRLAMFVSKERGADLARLTTLIDAGLVTPSLDRTYPLERVTEAMRLLGAGEVRGKVALTP